MKIIYIGNKLSKHGYTPTSVETLGLKLEESHETICVSDFKSQVLRFLHMMFTILKNYDADLVLIDTYSTYSFWYAVSSSKLALLLKIPYIAILRGGNLPYRVRNSPRISANYLRKAKCCVSPSNYLKSELSTLVDLNYVVIHNYIDLVNYKFKQRVLSPNTKVKILWVRSFHEIYNPKLAIHIIENLVNQHNLDVELCMVGPDKDGSIFIVKESAKKLGLINRITFTGKLTKSDWILLSEEFHLFINTTNVDNTPVSVMEAMALGMVVLSTNVGGIPYIIENEQDGILVEPNDANAFSSKIMELINQPDKVKNLSQAARSKAEAWDWNHIAQKWEDLFSSINNK